MTISEAQYQEMLARTQRNAGRLPPQGESIANESDLHNEIIELCRSKGWYYVHSRMDRKTTTALGVPDFVIATENGVAFLECKAKGGKPTPAQLATIAHLKKLNRIAAIVTNMDEVHWMLRVLQ